jgi:hypothetical protein
MPVQFPVTPGLDQSSVETVIVPLKDAVPMHVPLTKAGALKVIDPEKAERSIVPVIVPVHVMD